MVTWQCDDVRSSGEKKIQRPLFSICTSNSFFFLLFFKFREILWLCPLLRLGHKGNMRKWKLPRVVSWQQERRRVIEGSNPRDLPHVCKGGGAPSFSVCVCVSVCPRAPAWVRANSRWRHLCLRVRKERGGSGKACVSVCVCGGVELLATPHAMWRGGEGGWVR